MTDADAEYDSVEDALKDALGKDDNSMLRRVLRESQGKMARPAAIDYVAAMSATDGAVGVELDFNDARDRVVFRYLPDDDAYERYGDFQSSGKDVGLIPRNAITRWVGRYGTKLVLEADVRELFEDDEDDVDEEQEADRARTDGGHFYHGK